jgi:hypothetical protein
MATYVPGTLESDPKKLVMSLQQIGPRLDGAVSDIATNTTNIATNTINIATNTTNIATLQTKTSGYESAWTAYTPTIDAAAGSFTTVSGVGRYKQIGKTVFFTVTITITTNGTASSWVRATLPNSTTAAANFSLSGRDDTAGIELHARITSGATRADIFKIDGTYPGADGKTLFLSGVYEAA